MVRAAVVVMGDLGRSPRMNYHCLSISKLPNSNVDFIGFKGTTCRNDILESKNIKLHQMEPKRPAAIVEKNFALRALFKVLYQSYWLLSVLFSIQRPDFIICQTPPFLPVIPILLLYCLIRRSKLIIDWHNFGYTLISEKHKVIRLIYKTCEKFFGYYASGNLCVTKAMQKELLNNWNIKANVLYDRAPTFFRETSTKEKHKLFLELNEEISEESNITTLKEVLNITPFTIEYKSGVVELRKDRPALLVSSTSWTDDEDFSILLDALEQYDSYLINTNTNSNNNNHNNNNKESSSIKILAIITGKGPNRKYYENKIRDMKFKYIKIVTLWLSAENYPLLLGSSDLGVSLHLSSSGLDLPMKVVDMFGANLPVAAVGFNCLDELVKDSINGLIFHTSTQLFKHLKLLFDGFPNKDVSTLMKLKEGTKEFQKIRWEDNWNDVVPPLLML